MTEDLGKYLEPTEYIDADHPDVVARARELTRDCRTDAERLERIYYFVRELPYDILAAFRYLADGRRRASHRSRSDLPRPQPRERADAAFPQA